MPARNILYAQSGGVTAVINATASAVIATARHYPNQFNTIFAAQDGILGVLHEKLIDTTLYSENDVAALAHTPGGAFGSCRYKLKGLKEHHAEYERLLEVFAAHDIGYFFYNGGGDSQDTANKVAQMSAEKGHPLVCIGIPKTIDNDLPFTDNCPGFGSAAKYVALSMCEAGFDVASMASSSTKIFVMEVMGRHAGWLAAATGLAHHTSADAPHIILFPEIPFVPEKFLARVKETVERVGYCAITVSEGVQGENQQLLSHANQFDAFGHVQLGGVAPLIANLIQQKLGFKYHWAVLDYLQRSARHIASQTDFEQAFALGRAAVEFAVAGKNAVMPIIVRESDSPYRWHISEAKLQDVANVERKMPREFISEEGFHITQTCREYLLPLIQGEAYPPYQQGLPQYVRLERKLAAEKLKGFSA